LPRTLINEINVDGNLGQELRHAPRFNFFTKVGEVLVYRITEVIAHETEKAQEADR
jgi:hypothetical protein